MTAVAEPRASVVRHARSGLRNLHEKADKIPQSAQVSTGVWKVSREDLGVRARLEHMFRLAVALILVIALVGATADLARGRRPVLFA